jgi:hypothetical protein
MPSFSYRISFVHNCTFMGHDARIWPHVDSGTMSAGFSPSIVLRRYSFWFRSTLQDTRTYQFLVRSWPLEVSDYVLGLLPTNLHHGADVSSQFTSVWICFAILRQRYKATALTLIGRGDFRWVMEKWNFTRKPRGRLSRRRGGDASCGSVAQRLTSGVEDRKHHELGGITTSTHSSAEGR